MKRVQLLSPLHQFQLHESHPCCLANSCSPPCAANENMGVCRRKREERKEEIDVFFLISFFFFSFLAAEDIQISNTSQGNVMLTRYCHHIWLWRPEWEIGREWDDSENRNRTQQITEWKPWQACRNSREVDWRCFAGRKREQLCNGLSGSVGGSSRICPLPELRRMEVMLSSTS